VLRSLVKYFKYFLVTIISREERKLLIRDLLWYIGILKINTEIQSQNKRLEALHLAANWLIQNQKYNLDNGYSTYRIVEGHSASYPETSGYIISSLFNYSEKYSKSEIYQKLISCADWLVSIQKPSGGWQSGYVDENKPEVVFNTGQVIRGLLSAYKFSNEPRYLTACEKAGKWLCAVQEPNGSWKKFAFMNVERVYETYVSAPLLELWELTGNENFKNTAIKNLNWVVGNKILSNGWFQDCDNTIKHNDRPILHTIAYTLDGLIDSGIILNNTIYIEKAKVAADELLSIFNQNNYLWGRYDKNWNPTESFICTGGAQICVVWLKLYKLTKEVKYLNAAKKMNGFLCSIQSGTVNMKTAIKGGLQGSFPIWGRYEPFAFPNWATKYLLDALMMEEEFK
jgi:hypothetical protein